jgi:cytochrome c oxidase assembly factor 4
MNFSSLLKSYKPWGGLTAQGSSKLTGQIQIDTIIPMIDENDQQAVIQRTGCSEVNDELLLCYDQHRDWRKCRPEVEAFRSCYKLFTEQNLKHKLPQTESHDKNKDA